MLAIEDIAWHDAQLNGFRLVAGNQGEEGYDLEMNVSIYSRPDDAKRTRKSIAFEEIHSMIVTCDFIELVENMDAGNIGNGYVVKRGPLKVLRLYLSDGYIEITYRSSITSDR